MKYSSTRYFRGAFLLAKRTLRALEKHCGRLAYEKSHGSLSNGHLDHKNHGEGAIANLSSYDSEDPSSCVEEGVSNIEKGLVTNSHVEDSSTMALCTISFP